MKLETHYQFEAAHIIPNHDGKCRRLHGHSFLVTLTFEGGRLAQAGQKEGMLVDFDDVDAAWKPIFDKHLDHYPLNETLPCLPTAENIARWIFLQMSPGFPTMTAARVQEGPGMGAAEYRGNAVGHGRTMPPSSHEMKGLLPADPTEAPEVRSRLDMALSEALDGNHTEAFVQLVNAIPGAGVIAYHGMPASLDRAGHKKIFSGRHVMVSFAAPSILGHTSWAASVVLDNGAYSTWRRGQEFNYAEYIEWARLAMERPNVEWALIPDVIDGTEEDNDARIIEWPGTIPGVPVWHLHESFERLEQLCRISPRIALGSSGDYNTPGTAVWYDRMCAAWPHIPPATRVHGLRMLRPAIIEAFPFSSADSTTAGRNAQNPLGFPMSNSILEKCTPETRARACAEYLESSAAPSEFTGPRHSQMGLL